MFIRLHRTLREASLHFFMMLYDIKSSPGEELFFVCPSSSRNFFLSILFSPFSQAGGGTKSVLLVVLHLFFSHELGSEQKQVLNQREKPGLCPYAGGFSQVQM